MLKRIRSFLTKTAAVKVAEHLALAFASAFALAAIATTEHAAQTHGFSLTWSFAAGVGMSALTAAYQAVRPQLASIAAKVVKGLALGAKTKA